jgi:hypothetical protein
MQFDITTKDFDKALISKVSMSESLADLIAWAVGLEEYDHVDVADGSLEWMDSQIDYVLKEFDWEETYLQKLNREGYVPDPYLPDDGTGEAWEVSELLYGAWLKLERPTQFDGGLESWKDEQKDIVNECLGGYAGRKGIDDGLAKELDDAYDGASRDMFKEWLKGDHRDWHGVEGEFERWADKSNRLIAITLDPKDCYERATVEIMESDVRQVYLDLFDPEDDKIDGRVNLEKAIKEEIVGRLAYDAKRNYDADTVKRKARSDAYAEQRKREDERKKKAEEAERQRLLAMKRK